MNIGGRTIVLDIINILLYLLRSGAIFEHDNVLCEGG
jgi:hypothetical protein